MNKRLEEWSIPNYATVTPRYFIALLLLYHTSTPSPGTAPLSVRPITISRPSVAANKPTRASPPKMPKRRDTNCVADSTCDHVSY